MKIPVVDTNDEVIGYKERDEIGPDDIFRTASLWIHNSRGEILLAQRAHSKTIDPSMWGEAVGGTVEGDDTYEETIIREASEELGLELKTPQKGPKQYIETSRACYFVQWYRLVLDEPVEKLVFQPDEIQGLKWVSLADLRDDLERLSHNYVSGMKEMIELLESRA